MQRRDYLSCIGAAGIGGAGAARSGRAGTPSLQSIERVGSSKQVALTPVSAMLFEVAVPDDVDPTDVDWELGDLSGGPLLDLSYATGNATRSVRFEELGSYTIRARHDGTTVEWAITVAEDGRDPPRIGSLSTTPGPDATIGVADS